MGFRHAEIGQQQRDRLAAHRAAAVPVDRELAGVNLVLGARLGDQPLGEGRVLAWGEHPAGDIAADDVEDHVEIEVRPLGRGPAAW